MEVWINGRLHSADNQRFSHPALLNAYVCGIILAYIYWENTNDLHVHQACKANYVNDIQECTAAFAQKMAFMLLMLVMDNALDCTCVQCTI